MKAKAEAKINTKTADKGLFINDVIIFGGYRDPPPLPLVIIRHFLATPPHRARNSRQN